MPAFVYGRTRKKKHTHYGMTPHLSPVGGTYTTPVAATPSWSGPSPVPGSTAPADEKTPGPPLDPALEAQKAATQQGLKVGDAWDTYAGAQIENQYGFGVDTSNPYSRAKLLQESFQKSQRANTNSYAPQGQLYAGSLQNAQDASLGSYNQSRDAELRAYQAAKDALLKGKLDRYRESGESLDSADLASILKALGAV